MTSSTGPTPERWIPPPRWTQPGPPRTDENLKHVHRKIDRNLKSGIPRVDNLPQNLAGAPNLMARLAPGVAVETPARPVRAEGSTDEDFLAKAWEERMAKQWEDVTARLCRDFAPNGGAETDAVLTLIAEQRRQLDSATVRDYLPVLVDKAVRRLLDPDEAARD
ncbi:MAG: three-helix bundle dimerization domain-containing protein [Actinomycetes bacterium]